MEKVPTKPTDSYRVLLLASYCEADNPNCNEERPCIDCLSMCNVFYVDKHAVTNDNFIETLDYLAP